MKRILICILLLWSPLSVQGFLGNDLGLDLYKGIDEGIEELESNTYIYEVVGESGSIKEEINRILIINNSTGCLGGDISIEEFNKIAAGDLQILTDKISEECFDINEKINISTLANIQQTIATIAKNKRLEAKKKVTNIYKTARVGIYTNGDLSDSPFDLMADLVAIDAIIFGEPFEYSGTHIKHLNELNSRQDPRLVAATKSSNVGGVTSLNTGEDSITKKIDSLENYGENICIDPVLHGNLSNTSLESIFGSSSSIKKPILRKKESTQVSSSDSYERYSDDDNWDCDGPYCVKVEYLNYTQKALQASEKFSIKKVIETSNGHLKKFTNASLLQSNMTKNFYELGLIVKDLPSMFNMGVLVMEKPVPIINVGSNTVDEEATYGKNNLLEQYYASRGLEYNRRNSIKDLEKTNIETVAIQNCAELPATCVVENLATYNSYVKQSIEESKALKDSLEQVGLYSGNDEFFRLFAELDGFISGLVDYTTKLKVLIKKIKKIAVVTK